MSAFRDRIQVVDDSAKQTGALGPKVAPSAVGTYWADVRLVSAQKRAAYQQSGYGDVTHEVFFRKPIPLAMKDRRYLWATNGNATLVPAGPPADVSGRGRFRRILVKEALPSEV